MDSSQSRSEELRAFVVGTSSYLSGGEFFEIKHAENDANDVFEILTNSPTSIFPREASVKYVNLNITQLHQNLKSFFSQVNGNDLVLVYFAGHAKVVAGKILFLAMTDTDPNFLSGTAFCVDSLIPFFAEKKISKYIIVLDCCRAATALKSPGVSHRGIINDTDLGLRSGHGKIIIASALEYQLAYELDALKHGLFSNYFIEGIKTGLATVPTNKYIPIIDLVSYIQRKSRENHSDVYQEPLISGDDMLGQLYIARNLTYSPAPESNTLLLAYIEQSKRLLNLQDLTDEGKVKRARTKKFQQFLDSLSELKITFDSLKHLAVEYGIALGLDESTISDDFRDYSTRLNFKTIAIKSDALVHLNGNGKAILFSAAYSSRAYESVELEASVFVYYFLKGMKGEAANSQGLVTLSSLFEYLNLHVQDYEHFSQKPILVAQMSIDPILAAGNIDWAKSTGRRIAILVGIDHHSDNRLGPLRYAVADTKRVADALGHWGGFETITILDATYSNIMKTLNQYTEGLGKDDLLLFFFSGHGFSRNEDGYAVMYDYNPGTDGSQENVLSVSRLSSQLASTKVGTSLVILDACMSPAHPAQLLGAESKPISVVPE